ncbi:MAG: DUF2141 domain-containing protein [Raineya sp.]|jgi:uncharacterized protein (DUF2141 family)|nr:DUF2141 domain-containing protein [Raineya sp.]
MIKALLVIPIFFIFTSFSPQATGKLKIEITKIQSTKGKVLLNLFNNAKGFPTQNKYAYKTAELEIKDGKAYVEFSDLPYGDYAVAVLHDENDNKKMDYNFLGMPKEGYCFSNNYRPTIKNPSFRQAGFFLERSSKSLQLEMIY